MATSRPFAYNPGEPILGTDQIGDLAIGVEPIDYSGGAGGVKWWNGPDEDLGYVIAQSVPEGNQPAPGGTTASIGFFRTNEKTEESFVDLANTIQAGSTEIFTNGSEAKSWLNANGYWTSFESSVEALVTDGLILYFNFAEPTSYPGTGTSVFDLSGNNYTGTISNLTYASYNAITKSMDFTGLVASNSGISTGSKIGWGTGAAKVRSASKMTWGSLIRPTSVPFGSTGFRWSSFMSLDNFNVGNIARKFTFYFYILNNNTTVASNLACDYFSGGFTATNLVATSSNFIGQDLYIVTTIEEGTGTAKLYINGILVDTKNGISLNSSPSASADLDTGRAQSSFPGLFAGKMYTQHAYDRVLSQSEITQNYNFLKNQFGI